jgi:hypothetical protein
MVADLVGDVAPLRALVPDDDAAGVSDSFNYGVSLNRVALPVSGDANLRVLPSGTEPVATEEIFRSERWRRMAADCRADGAMLLLVAPASGPSLHTLFGATDGAILVGDVEVQPESSHIIARVHLPTPGPAAMRTRAPDAAARVVPPAAPSAVPDVGTTSAPFGVRTPASDRAVRLRTLGLAFGALVVIVAGIGIWRGTREPSAGLAAASTVMAPDPVDAGGSAPEIETPPAVLNPLDSAIAATFAVEVVAANTLPAALEHLQLVRAHPAATLTPGLGGVDWRWYRVVVGAYVDRAAADALAGRLRQAGVLGEQTDRVVQLPYALLLASSIPSDSVASQITAYVVRGIPAYALAQDDGTSRLFAGAFASPEEAMLMAPQLRVAGIEPAIVYRTGRAF